VIAEKKFYQHWPLPGNHNRWGSVKTRFKKINSVYKRLLQLCIAHIAGYNQVYAVVNMVCSLDSLDSITVATSN